MKKILVIRLGAIGDVVFTTIIPYAIKLMYPDYKIHYLVPNGIDKLLEDNPCIDKIFIWERCRRKSFKYLFSIAGKLRREKYDVIFNLNNTLRCFLLSSLAMPKKIVSKQTTGGHWVDDAFFAAKKVFPKLEKPNRLFLSAKPEAANKIREDISGFPRPYIMIAPGGDTSKNRAGRSWSIDYWKELSKMIIKEYGGTIFVCGSDSEKEFHSTLSNERVVVFSGKYNLAESSALLSMADLMISGDTGPLHIASAHNIKTLALLGSTSPDKICPYGENGHWISSDFECKYCWKKKCKYVQVGEETPCMGELKPDFVLSAVKKIFEQ